MNKKRHINLLASLILTTLALLACSITIPQGLGTAVRGSGNVVEETRAVSGVSGVELATLGQLFIEVGDVESPERTSSAVTQHRLRHRLPLAVLGPAFLLGHIQGDLGARDLFTCGF